MKRKVLVVDIGGNHVKLLMSSRDQREFASGPRMRPGQMIARFKETVHDWKFDIASIGFPARVRKGRIIKRSKTFGQRLGRLQFWQGARQTGARNQRCGHASTRQLSWGRTHAFSWTWD